MSTTLVVSDIHLGSPVSRVKAFAKVLRNEKYKKLIINGDLFDNNHMGKYKKHHWKIISLIRKISKKKDVVLIKGNHDIHSFNVIRVLDMKFHNEYEMDFNGKKILFMHFHQFDSFISKHPIITAFAESIYYFLQSLDRSKKFSRWIKRTSKRFLQVKVKIRNKALDYIKDLPYDCIIGGHIHFAESFVCSETGKEYHNSGSFCDDPCHYLLIDKNGEVTLKEV